MRIDQALFYLCSGHQVPGGYSAGLLDVSAAAGERGGGGGAAPAVPQLREVPDSAQPGDDAPLRAD